MKPVFYITFRNRRGDFITERVITDDPHGWVKRNTFRRYIAEVVEIKEG